MSKQRQKGTKFESAFVEYERAFFEDTEKTIRRLPLSGRYDEGDIGGIYFHGKKVAIECKDHKQYRIKEWLQEVERERGNADADFGVVVFHIHGVGISNMGKQAVLMDVDTFNHFIERGNDGA